MHNPTANMKQIRVRLLDMVLSSIYDGFHAAPQNIDLREANGYLKELKELDEAQF